MVKVLANGDLVPDDDPRAAGSAHQRPNTASGGRDTGRGNVHSTPPPQADAAHQAGQTTSVFDSLNQRLLAAGVPPWNAGPYVVEPIVSVGFLLALFFMGIQGLIFAALLFFVVKYSGMGGQGGGMGGGGGGTGGGRMGGVGRGSSQGPGGAGTGSRGGDGSRGSAFSGAGHRLGQS